MFTRLCAIYEIHTHTHIWLQPSLLPAVVAARFPTLLLLSRLVVTKSRLLRALCRFLYTSPTEKCEAFVIFSIQNALLPAEVVPSSYITRRLASTSWQEHKNRQKGGHRVGGGWLERFYSMSSYILKHNPLKSKKKKGMLESCQNGIVHRLCFAGYAFLYTWGIYSGITRTRQVMWLL